MVCSVRMQKSTIMDMFSVFFTVTTMFGVFLTLDAETTEEAFTIQVHPNSKSGARPTQALSPADEEPDAGMADAMDELQVTGELAFKQVRDKVLPQDETDKLYNQMARTLDVILDLVLDPVNAHHFLITRGFDRVIAPYLGVRFPQVRSRLLLLTKMLFNIDPTTTKNLIPVTVLDRLLDIFEHDADLGMKTYAMDILSHWLPGSPRAQERVMKVKGLDPFYFNVSKLDKSVISIALQLFSILVKEHMAVRNMKVKESKADYDTLKTYRQIGLIERLSTPAVCNGLLNIFEQVSSFNTETLDDLNPVIELLQIVKPHCFKVYKGRPKAIQLIDVMLKIAQDADNKVHFEKLKLNATELVEFLADFAIKVKPEPRKEL